MTRCLSLLLALLVGCGGTSATPTGGQTSATDARVDDAVRDLVASSAAPNASFDALAAELLRLFEEASDPDAAVLAAIGTLLGALESADDVDALLAASRNLGEVFPLQFLLEDAGLAQNGVLCPDAPAAGGTVLYYVNGVGTTADRACATLINLRKRMLARFGAEADDIEYRLFHNSSGLEDRSFWCRAVGLLGALSTSPLSGLPSVSPLADRYASVADACGFVEDLGEAGLQLLERIRRAEFVPDEVSRLRSSLAQDIVSGKTVILVAHSQGNLFVQQALASLPTTDRRAVGVVAIASPIVDVNATTYGDFRHFMMEFDILRTLPTAPDANVTNELNEEVRRALVPLASPGRLAVHGIDESYLYYSGTLDPIRVAIIAIHRSLENASATAGQGFFQVTATWDTPGDMDLHVLEPAGDHVFWADRVGSVGELDRDDIVGVGPENYFVCSPVAMAEGEYEIYVNNFGGATGTEIRITIRAGPLVREFTRVVGDANGGADLVFVASVFFDADGSFTVP